MALYRVKEGLHVDEAGQSYKKGDVVDTEHDLVRMFPNKFTRVQGFRGRQAETEAFPDDMIDPVPSKDNTLPDSGLPQGSELPEAEEDDDEVKTDLEPADSEDFGEDVTEDFPKAKRAGVTVRKKGRNYTVLGSDGEPVSNEHATTKKQVETLIEDL